MLETVLAALLTQAALALAAMIARWLQAQVTAVA